MSLHMMGAREIGFDFDYQKLAGGLLSTAGDIASSVQAQEAAEKASAADKSKAEAAIAADARAATAKAAALTSAAIAAATPNKASQAKASADQAALNVASSAQDAAGAKVPVSSAPLRVDAAQQGIAAATAKLQASPTDVYAQNLVKAWEWVANKAQYGQIVKNAPEGKKEEGGLMMFLKKPLIGPVEVWHAAAGVGILGAIWYAAKKGLFKKLFGG